MDFNFADRVRSLAAARGLSVSQVEKNAGWRRGQLFTALKLNSPTLRTVIILCGVFDVTLVEFFEGY